MRALWDTWSCMFLRLVQAEGFNIQTVLIFYRLCPGMWMGDVLQKFPKVQVWGAAWIWITYWCTIDLMALGTGWRKELKKKMLAVCYELLEVGNERVWESAPAVFQSKYPCWGRKSYVLKYAVIWDWNMSSIGTVKDMSNLVKC